MPPTIKRTLGRIAYAGRASRAIAGQPYEGMERTIERLAEWRDSPGEGWRHGSANASDERLHTMLGAPWPCPDDGFEDVWAAAQEDLRARGLQVGRGAFGGWDDGDRRLVRLAWCAARHLRPERVVETGVARGLTTRVLLEALERNGRGRLWSIDLPPLLESDLAEETGAAVPEHLSERWTLLRGSSRRILPGLVAGLGHVDLFIHDSMHTGRNLRFELEQVWPALRPGGALLIDDVEKNAATDRFLRERPSIPAAVFFAEDKEAMIAALVKPAS